MTHELSLAHTAFLALGSNLGDRESSIRRAVEALAECPGVWVVRTSTIIETEPEGALSQHHYLNAVVKVETAVSPRGLLDAALEIERRFGRVRTPGLRNEPRTLDIDLLLYGNLVLDEPGLAIPHPRMYERLFVLEPLAEIAPDFVHPTIGRTVRFLRDRLARPGWNIMQAQRVLISQASVRPQP